MKLSQLIILLFSVMSLSILPACTSSQTDGDEASAEVTDESLEMAEAVDNNDDLALERIINIPKRGLGTNTTSLIHSYAKKNNISFFSASQELLMTDELRPNVKRSLLNLINQFLDWNNQNKEIPHTDLALKVLEESGYIGHWQNEKSLDGEGRLENLKELIELMSFIDLLDNSVKRLIMISTIMYLNKLATVIGMIKLLVLEMNLNGRFK